MRSWCVNCPNWYPMEKQKARGFCSALIISFVWQLPFNPFYSMPFPLTRVRVSGCSPLMGVVWPWLDIKELQILFGNGHFVSSYHVILDFEEKVSQPFFSACILCVLNFGQLWTSILRWTVGKAYLLQCFLLRNNGIRSTKNEKWWLTGCGQCEKGGKKPSEEHQIAKV